MMVLVDTSVWVAHLRSRSEALVAALERGAVIAHDFVEGELALGDEKQRRTILPLYRRLFQAPIASHAEVLALLETHRLARAGIGWVDAHLLAAAILAGADLFTRDRALAGASQRLGIRYCE